MTYTALHFNAVIGFYNYVKILNKIILCEENTKNIKVIMSSRLTFVKCKQIRWYSTKQKMKVIDEVDELLLTNQLKHRHHPGISSPRQVQHPSWLCDSIKALAGVNNISLKQVQQGTKRLTSYLHERQLPKEADDIETKIKDIKSHTKTININVGNQLIMMPLQAWYIYLVEAYLNIAFYTKFLMKFILMIKILPQNRYLTMVLVLVQSCGQHLNFGTNPLKNTIV